jgi:hypothetical protein
MKKLTAPIPRVALTPPEAAASLGVGPDFFDAEIAPDLKVIRRGRKRLIPLAEIERWTRDHAEPTLPRNRQGDDHAR